MAVFDVYLYLFLSSNSPYITGGTSPAPILIVPSILVQVLLVQDVTGRTNLTNAAPQEYSVVSVTIY